MNKHIRTGSLPVLVYNRLSMTTFVDQCVQTVAGRAHAVAKTRGRGRPRARRLLKALAGKKRILVTTHQHPDPDALASALGMRALLAGQLKEAEVSISVKGNVGGGINEAFTRFACLDLVPWRDSKLANYDAIILLDVQPAFAYSPLPADVVPTAVIDHHSVRGRRPRCDFCDIRSDIGATTSIVFSYFMELEMPIAPDLSAAMLYGIESDLAGSAGEPVSLDNVALATLTLTADTHLLYKMRYVDLPQTYYVAYASGLSSALWADGAVVSHIGEVDSLEKPAVIADFLLRFEKVQWSLVTAVHGGRLILSLRTSAAKGSASAMMRRLVRGLGEGGGHRTKAGGFVPLENGTPTEIDRVRKKLRRRLLRALHIGVDRLQHLV
jgi:nanoRNase/pAp phosphatase (c-di-AMP/oligoRNAs hydrolase)